MDFQFIREAFLPIAAKAYVSIYIAIISMIISIILASIFGIIVLKKVPGLAQIVRVFNSFIKGVPIVIQLYIAYYTLPLILYAVCQKLGIPYDIKNQSALVDAIVAFSINYAAYMTDVVITSINSVEHGQLEAGYAMGLTTFQTFKRVIIPQAVLIAIPNTANQFIALLKATSMAYLITVVEVMGKGKQLAAGTFKFFEAYIIVAIVYCVLCIVVEKVISISENNLSKSKGTIIS